MNVKKAEQLANPKCDECQGYGSYDEGEFDNIQEVPCICVKEALQDKEMQEI